jgi:hypothetical protein
MRIVIAVLKTSRTASVNMRSGSGPVKDRSEHSACSDTFFFFIPFVCIFTVIGASDIMDAWRGKIAERIVAQELLALDSRVSNQRNFWVRNKKDSEAEVDFVLQRDGMIIPIKVISGHNAKLRSLRLFMDEAPHDIAVRVWSQPLSVDDVTTQEGKPFRPIDLPFYYVGRLEEILKNAKGRMS